MGDDPGLAAARPGQDQQRAVEVQDGLALGLGQVLQQMFHLPIYTQRAVIVRFREGVALACPRWHFGLVCYTPRGEHRAVHNRRQPLLWLATSAILKKNEATGATGSRLFGSVGEAIFFAVMLVAGCACIVYDIAWVIIPEWRVNHGFSKPSARSLKSGSSRYPAKRDCSMRRNVAVDRPVQTLRSGPV